MESTDVDKTMSTKLKSEICKTYVSPSFRRLSLAAARNLLSRHTDRNDTKLQQIIEGIDQLHGAKGS